MSRYLNIPSMNQGSPAKNGSSSYPFIARSFNCNLKDFLHLCKASIKSMSSDSVDLLLNNSSIMFNERKLFDRLQLASTESTLQVVHNEPIWFAWFMMIKMTKSSKIGARN